MANKIKIRRGLKANLPTLSVGEQALCTDTSEIFIGGSTGNIQFANKEYVATQLAQDALNLSTHAGLQGINAHGLSGKIIHSSGSNANGTWVRFDDGTAILRANKKGVSTEGAGGSTTVVLPLALSTNDYFAIAEFDNFLSSATINYVIRPYIFGEGSVFFIYKPTSGSPVPATGTLIPDFRVFILGRWK